MAKIVNTRLSDEVAADLEAVASYDGVAVAELVREGISKLLESRRADPEFKQRVLDFAERTREMLLQLGEHDEAKRYEFADSDSKANLAAPH